MEDKIKLAKGITKFVVGIGVGSVTKQIIKNNASPTNALESVQVLVGAYVIAGMLTDRAIDWTGPKFDQAVERALQIKATLMEDAE